MKAFVVQLGASLLIAMLTSQTPPAGTEDTLARRVPAQLPVSTGAQVDASIWLEHGVTPLSHAAMVVPP
jgi:hypothetical protein